jgi:hypothetical protein
MPTRDLFLLPQELPFQNRDFVQTRHIPQMGCGGPDGYTNQVQVETCLREKSSRDPRGCNIYEFRDLGNVIPLLCAWQQPDYRPLYFAEDTRNYIKDVGRAVGPLPHGWVEQKGKNLCCSGKGVWEHSNRSTGVYRFNACSLGHVIKNTIV